MIPTMTTSDDYLPEEWDYVQVVTPTGGIVYNTTVRGFILHKTPLVVCHVGVASFGEDGESPACLVHRVGDKGGTKYGILARDLVRCARPSIYPLPMRKRKLKVHRVP